MRRPTAFRSAEIAPVSARLCLHRGRRHQSVEGRWRVSAGPTGAFRPGFRQDGRAGGGAGAGRRAADRASTGRSPILSCTLREDHYGVLTEALVIDKTPERVLLRAEPGHDWTGAASAAGWSTRRGRAPGLPCGTPGSIRSGSPGRRELTIELGASRGAFRRFPGTRAELRTGRPWASRASSGWRRRKTRPSRRRERSVH